MGEQEAREEVVEALARSAEVYGLNRSYGRLYGRLYFAEEPMSLDDLASTTGYAKSTVSTAMSALERLHLARRVSVPDAGKRAYFEAERDLWYVFQQLLENEVRREIRIMSRALESAETELEDTEGDRAERDLQRVRELQTVYGEADVMVDLFSRLPAERLAALARRALGGDDNS